MAVATPVWATQRKRERKMEPVAVNAAVAAMIGFPIVLESSHQKVAVAFPCLG